MVNNFEKPIEEFTEKELLRKINESDPKFGTLCYYELSRQLAIKNDQSSRRFAKWSLVISIVAIILSLLK